MKKRKCQFIVLGVIVFIALVIFTCLTIFAYKQKDAIQKQLDLGQKYLDELQYDQAITTYLAVIEIDEKSVEAYIGAAKAYVGLDDYENAIAILETGIKITDDESLKKYLKELQEQWVLEDATSVLEEPFEEKRKVVDGGGFFGGGDICQYENCVVSFSDGTSSDVVPEVELVYGILDTEDAVVLKDIFEHEYDNETFRTRLQSSFVCPTCGTLCDFLCAAGGGNDETYTYGILEYCESCEKICAIGCIGEIPDIFE